MVDEKEKWFSNKDLLVMIDELKAEMGELKINLAETTTLIRDYNGLRQKINDCERKLVENQGKAAGGKDMWGYIFGAAMFLLAVASFLSK